MRFGRAVNPSNRSRQAVIPQLGQSPALSLVRELPKLHLGQCRLTRIINLT